jgi:hypothetical protein
VVRGWTVTAVWPLMNCSSRQVRPSRYTGWCKEDVQLQHTLMWQPWLVCCNCLCTSSSDAAPCRPSLLKHISHTQPPHSHTHLMGRRYLNACMSSTLCCCCCPPKLFFSSGSCCRGKLPRQTHPCNPTPPHPLDGPQGQPLPAVGPPPAGWWRQCSYMMPPLGDGQVVPQQLILQGLLQGW